MTITLGTISKRKNSTKRGFVSGSDTFFNVQLKEKTSFNAPVFLVNFQKIYKTDLYNYCHWNGNYYWIDDIVYVTGDLYEIHCSMDLLATYRDFIKTAKARVLYCSNQAAWNDKEDDPRFSPTDLNVYVTNSELNNLANQGAYYSNANVFGNNYDLWDISADTFVLQAKSSVGLTTYILSDEDFKQLMQDMSSVFWSGAGNFGKDVQNYIIGCDLIPINYNKLKSLLKGKDIGAMMPMYMGNGTIGSRDYYAIPNITILNFQGSLSSPRVSNIPFFMQSNKWNKTQLITPGGTTDINRDMTYRQGKTYFSTKWDITTGDINTRFQLHAEASTIDGFNDLEGNTFYESNFNINSDAMGLVQKRMTVGSMAEKAVGTGLVISAAALTAGATMGASSGITKLKSSADSTQRDISRLLSGKELEPALNNIEHNTKVGGSPSTVLATGILASKLTKPIDISTPGGPVASNFARLSNTKELGLIHYSNTLLRCKELHRSGESLMESYRKYCNTYGYPVNDFYVGTNGIYDCITKGSGSTVEKQYIVADNVIIEPPKDTSKYFNDEILDALEKAIQSGFYYE